jgi:hypothetical protein
MTRRRTPLTDADQRWVFPKKTYREYYCIHCGKKFTDLKSLALHRNRCQQANHTEETERHL